MIKTIKTLSYFGYFKRHLYAYPRLAFEMLLQRATRKRRALLAEIFFETRCNLQCWHCSSSEYVGKKKARSLTYSQLEAIVKKLRHVGVLSICYVGGEPLINPELNRIINMTHRHKILTAIITNGTLLTPQKIDDLFSAGLANLGFSMQSSNPEVHDSLVGKKGAYEHMVSMIDYCIAKKRTASICVVPTNENIANGDFQSMVDFATQRRMRLNVNLPAPVGRWIDKPDCILNEASLKIVTERYFPLDNFFPDFKQANIRHRIHCPMAEDNLYIFPDGEVCPCTFTHISFGNILEESAETILRRMDASPTLKHIARENICPISMDPEFIGKVHRAIKMADQYPPRAEDVDF